MVQGCPLRVRWGRPKALDSLDTDVRMMHAREGREVVKAVAGERERGVGKEGEDGGAGGEGDLDVIAPPPGQDDVQYPSLAGN